MKKFETGDLIISDIVTHAMLVKNGKKDLCPACMMAVIDLLARPSAKGKEESSNGD